MIEKLAKINRIMAWILLATILLYIITGYGMTKELIDPSLAAKLHLSYLAYPMIIAFIYHTAYAIRLAFMRWGIWNTFGKILLLGSFILLFGGFIFVDRFYHPQSAEKAATKSTNSLSSSAASKPSVARSFTVAQLAKYNGKNGNPSYVAVDGDVYDLSSVFKDGYHASHYAGKDLTGAFYSRHAKSVLSKYPIVGKLVK